MNADLLPNIDPGPLDTILLDDKQRTLPYPADLLRKIPLDVLRVWASKRSRYQLVTNELLVWLHEKIAGRKAIEVGAGMGDLGYRLNIPMTDSAVQTQPQIRAYYRSLGQCIIDPPLDVERLDAEAAIKRYQPQVVIASWLTQKWHLGDRDGTGSMHGVEESVIVDNCEMYIHIGHEDSHADKRIRTLPHQQYRFPWLVSRAADQDKNVIYVWENKL